MLDGRVGLSNHACPRFPSDVRPKNKNRPFGSAHVTSGRTKNARGRDARNGTNGRWKLDTRFISWSDCDFRRGFKYWKYRAAAFNLPRDPIGFYKRRKSARKYTRWRPMTTTTMSSAYPRNLSVERTLFSPIPFRDSDEPENFSPRWMHLSSYRTRSYFRQNRIVIFKTIFTEIRSYWHFYWYLNITLRYFFKFIKLGINL